MKGLSIKKALFGLYRLIYEVLLCLATWVTPKRKQMSLFAPFYSDTVNGNLWPLYRYINKHHPAVKTVIVAADRSLYRELKEKDAVVVLGGSAKCFMAAARAHYLFVDHNTGTVFVWGTLQALANLKVIQVWHGTGFKQIALLDEKAKPRGLVSALRYYDKKVRCKNYDCILSSSDEDKVRKENSFRNRNIFITGYPKTDALFNKEKPYSSSIYRKGQRFQRIILYAPTFRDRGTFRPFDEDFWEQLETEMKESSSLFLIKKHPQDHLLEAPAGYSMIRDLTGESVDLQALLLDTDLLITDYSNIAVDFVLTGRPVIYYTFDYESYVENCRSFFYDLKQTLPGPFVYNQETLLYYIQDQAWFLDRDYLNKYTFFKDRFHHYQDGNSCKRVVETLFQL